MLTIKLIGCLWACAQTALAAEIKAPAEAVRTAGPTTTAVGTALSQPRLIQLSLGPGLSAPILAQQPLLHAAPASPAPAAPLPAAAPASQGSGASLLERAAFWVKPPVHVPALDGSGDYQFHGTSFETLKRIVASGGFMSKGLTYFTDEVSAPKGYARRSARKTGTPGFVLQFDNAKLAGKLQKGHYQPVAYAGRGAPVVTSHFVQTTQDVPLADMTEGSKRNVLSWMARQRDLHPQDASWPGLIDGFKKALSAEDIPTGPTGAAAARRSPLAALGRLLAEALSGGGQDPRAVRILAEQKVLLPSEAQLREHPLERARLDALLGAPRVDGAALLELLKAAPFLKEQFESAGLEKHTLAALEQFEKYFPGPLPGGVDKGFFRLVLALHDIGKPQAAASGFREKQHQFTQEIMKVYLSQLGYQPAQIDLALALMAQDPVGAFLQGAKATEQAATLSRMAKASGLSSKDFLDLFLVFYMADAGSYTKDAGGRDTLGRLFEFDPGQRAMRFAPKTAARIEALKAEFFQAVAAAN